MLHETLTSYIVNAHLPLEELHFCQVPDIERQDMHGHDLLGVGLESVCQSWVGSGELAAAFQELSPLLLKLNYTKSYMGVRAGL